MPEQSEESTSWRENLRPASFRGVPFLVDESHVVIGRRVVLHEYPLRDKPYAEDLGKKAQVMRFSAYVIGSDYMDKRDALIEALELEGAGELIHPYFGSKTVTATEDIEIVESHEFGGMARFSLSFVEAGEQIFPDQSTDVDAKLEEKRQTFADKLKGWFSETFNVEGLNDYVSQDALDAVNEVLALGSMALGSLAWIRSTVGSDLSGLLPENLLNSLAGKVPLAAGLAALIDQATVLDDLIDFRLPGGVSNPDRTVSGGSGGGSGGGGSSSGSGGSSSGAASTVVKTTDRIAIETNREALNLFIQGCVISRQISEAVVPEKLGTAEGAQEAKQWIVERCDELIFNETFGSSDGGEALQALIDLRDTALEVIDAETPKLPRIETVRLRQDLPSVVVAHRLYGDRWYTESLDQELVTRNAVRRPLMMPADVELEAVIHDD
mgnify:FL=1